MERWLAIEAAGSRKLRKALEAMLEEILAEGAQGAEARLEKATPALSLAVLAFLQDAAAYGADVGAEQVATLGLGVDWTLVNETARDWARQYSYELVRGLNDTSRRVLQKEITQWVESGEHLDKLRQALEPAFGAKRAQMIAETETTRAFAQGAIASYQAGGVADREPEIKPPAHVRCRCRVSLRPEKDGSWTWIWESAVDELVCPTCGALHMQPVGLAKGAPTYA